MKTLIAKATAGEVIYLVAMVDRIAAILLLDGDQDPVAIRRSKALGILAHPARALALLERHEHPDTDADPDPDDVSPVEPVERCIEPVEMTPAPARPTSDWSLPPATLYVHLSWEAMLTGLGVARMEGVGPITIGQASEFLGHSHVTIKPVLDLETDRPVDGYEVPDRMREQLRLRNPASVFPWSPNTSRRGDHDHTVPYLSPDEGGPPGQTRIGNLGKLTRLEHRIKTHAPGWRHRQPEPGVHEWRTPTGHHFTVDHTGTHPHGTSPTTWVGSAHERALAALVAHEVQ